MLITMKKYSLSTWPRFGIFDLFINPFLQRMIKTIRVKCEWGIPLCLCGANIEVCKKFGS